MTIDNPFKMISEQLSGLKSKLNNEFKFSVFEDVHIKLSISPLHCDVKYFDYAQTMNISNIFKLKQNY